MVEGCDCYNGGQRPWTREGIRRIENRYRGISTYVDSSGIHIPIIILSYGYQLSIIDDRCDDISAILHNRRVHYELAIGTYTALGHFVTRA